MLYTFCDKTSMTNFHFSLKLHVSTSNVRQQLEPILVFKSLCSMFSEEKK